MGIRGRCGSQHLKENVGWNGEGRTRFGRDHGVDVAGAGEGVGVGVAPPCALLDAWVVPLACDGPVSQMVHTHIFR